MRRIAFILILLIATFSLSAQIFAEHFVDNTLRIDYIFTGNNDSETMALYKLRSTQGWAGRTKNLPELAREGNGQIVVCDARSGHVIYKDAFSSLFQEWQDTPEAVDLVRSFEHTTLIPFPKREIDVQLLLRTKAGAYVEVFTHRVNPADILIEKMTNKPKYDEIHIGGKISEVVNVAIVPEGYAEHEMEHFLEHARRTVNEIFAHSPFDKFRDKFNFYALMTPSKVSGVSVPRQNSWKQSLVSSHFDTFYADRYLTTSNVFDLHNALSGVPYSHIIILANTDIYGGGGIFNSYTLTTTGHSTFEHVVVHEFGHSFGGLADEYFDPNKQVYDDMYPLDVEPWEPNITTLVDFDSKWKDLLPSGTPIPTPPTEKYSDGIGVFEGGGYVTKGIYRPIIDCRMRSNESKAFCPACERAISQIIEFYCR